MTGLYSASGGYIWAECGGQNVAHANTVLLRFSPAGKMSTARQLTSAAELGPLTAGANGDMWAIGLNSEGYVGIVKISSSGTETLHNNPTGTTAVSVAGMARARSLQSSAAHQSRQRSASTR